MTIFKRFSKEDTSTHVEVSFSNQTILRVIALVLIAVLGYKFFNQIIRPLSLIGMSAFLAIALNPAVSWITHRLKSKSRVRATGFAYLLVIGFLIGFFALVTPPLVSQTREFIDEVPTIVRNFKTQDNSLARSVRRYKLDEQLQEVGNDIANRFGSVNGPVLSTAGRIGSGLIQVISVLILTFMMLIEGPRWMALFWRFYPDGEGEKRRRLVAMKMYRVVTGYVNGQLLISLIAASFAMVMMLIIGVQSAIALAGIVFLFGLIPMIGNTIAAAIVVLVTLFTDPKLAAVMLIYFLVYQQIENATLQPYIQAKHNEMTPLLVFVATLLGASFGGVLGAFVAIPAAGCLKVFLEDWVRHRRAWNEQPTEEV